jgi:hypothetical protein
MNKGVRIASTFGAIALGVVLINFLTRIGNKSKGPIEDFFDKAGSVISEAEYILMKEKAKRHKTLEWFAPYRTTQALRDPQHMLLGAFDNQSRNDFQTVVQLENMMQTNFPVIHIYSAWGSKGEQEFPAAQVRTIQELGSVPLITWEPWLTDFDQEEHSHLRDREKRDKNGLADIVTGNYDFYLDKWIEEVKELESPILLRWAHEMNDPYRYAWGPQNNEASDFVVAWRYVHDYFKKAAVKNVVWVWSPHIAYGYFKEYYPGDDYVDWVGVGTLNYGTVAKWSNWWSFEEIFGRHYPDLENFGKPIMISEFGSLAVGGDRTEWYKQAICDMPIKYPKVKSILFFHFNNDNTLTYQTLDWHFKNDSSIVGNIVDCINQWPDSLFVKQAVQ